MRKLVLGTAAVVVAVGSGLGVGAAAAASPSGHTIRVALQDIGFSNPSSACPGGTITFSMRTLRNAPAGTAASCIKSVTGCDPFHVGCRSITRSVFTLGLPAGSLRVPAVLREVSLGESSVMQLGRGRIVAGTGDYAGATGSLVGGGIVTFTDTGVDSGLVYAIHIHV